MTEDEYEKQINEILEDLIFHTIKNFTNPYPKTKDIVRKNIIKFIYIGSIYEKIFKKKRRI